MNVKEEATKVNVNQVTNTLTEIIESIDLPLLKKGGLLFFSFFLGSIITALVVRKACRFFFQEKTATILWKKLSISSSCLGGFFVLFIKLRYTNFLDTIPETILVNYVGQALITLAFFCLLIWFLSWPDAIFMLIHARLEAQGKPIPIALFFYGRVIKAVLITIFIIAVIPFLFIGPRAIDKMLRYLSLSTISLGAIIGITFQPVMKDILGGMFIISQHLFTEGDWISFNVDKQNVSGRVVDIDLRYTKLKRFTGSFLMVANKTFLTSAIENYGRSHYTSYTLPLSPHQQGSAKITHFLEAYTKLMRDTPYIEEEKCHATVKSLEVDKMELSLHIFFSKADDQSKIVRIHTLWQEILKLAKKNKISKVAS